MLYSNHYHLIKLSYTVKPRLSDSCLSVPSIIWIDVQKFLKQVIPVIAEHVIHRLLFNRV